MYLDSNRAAAALMLPLLLVNGAVLQAAPPDDERRSELKYLLKHDCGSCHGMRMDGGLGPPLKPEDLAAKPDAMLVQTVLFGKKGTPMPPWQALITEDEARWIVNVLKTGEAL